MEINYLAVALAALSAFVVGALWYSALFVKPWAALIGAGKDGKAPNSKPFGVILGVSLILEIIMAFNLAAFIGVDATWQFGLGAGLAAGLGWVAMAFGVNYLFEGRPFQLFLINAGYNVVSFAIMGLIIGAM